MKKSLWEKTPLEIIVPMDENHLRDEALRDGTEYLRMEALKIINCFTEAERQYMENSSLMSPITWKNLLYISYDSALESQSIPIQILLCSFKKFCMHWGVCKPSKERFIILNNPQLKLNVKNFLTLHHMFDVVRKIQDY